jgi:outer membrane biosynthesis protein TonB
MGKEALEPTPTPKPVKRASNAPLKAPPPPPSPAPSENASQQYTPLPLRKKKDIEPEFDCEIEQDHPQKVALKIIVIVDERKRQKGAMGSRMDINDVFNNTMEIVEDFIAKKYLSDFERHRKLTAPSDRAQRGSWMVSYMVEGCLT